MTSNWVKVYTTDDQYKAEILKQGLIAADISAVVMNKQDSSYKSFGLLTVFVNATDYDKAIEYIAQNHI